MTIRKKRIGDLVRQILGENSVSEPPVPVQKIAKRFGLKISFEPLESDLSGFLFQNKKNAVIGVNSSQSKVRQRFTISHELGHFLLHGLNTLHVDRAVQAKLRSDLSSKGTDPEEIEANWFAAELLMPSDFVAKDMAELEGIDILDEDTLVQLARRYNVSPQAFIFRLTNLGYVEQ